MNTESQTTTPINYKTTLNLPQTAFAMKANLPQREPELAKKWTNLYATLRAQKQGTPKFVFMDGPPYANGDIHIGHAVNKILKDMIVKTKNFAGLDAPFVPGWDCHGLPIEQKVEEKFGKVGQKLDAAAFRAECRRYALSQVERQKVDFQRLGILADWDNPYLTLKPDYEAEQVRALARMVERGHLMRGYKPVHWCVECGSSLAEAEVDYAEKVSDAIDVRFRVQNGEAIWANVDSGVLILETPPMSMVIWTTTPWTLPANQAVAVGAELRYALVRVRENLIQDKFSQNINNISENNLEKKYEYLIIAEDLVAQTMQRYGLELDDYMLTAFATGAQLVTGGVRLQHPFYDREVPLVLGEHVTAESGTGGVHIAPAHGVEDYAVGVLNHLPLENPVGTNGCYLDNVPFFAGKMVLKSNHLILEKLVEKNNLLHKNQITHSYPHCWRHKKTPLIFRATPQWFISMNAANLRADAQQTIPNVQWIPNWGQARIEAMMQDRPDWCISRQRTWGVPIPLFLHKTTGELHPNSLILMRKVADLMQNSGRGMDAWFELIESKNPENQNNLNQILGENLEDYQAVRDVLDVWFDSGVAHHCVPMAHPDTRSVDGVCDLFLEGSDQHRGWFQSSLLTSVAMFGRAPYRQVLTHGFVVDDKGRKMSKSLGNVVTPQAVIQKYGADVLRLWVASTDYSGEMAVSMPMMERVADMYRRIRNTLRFLLANINNFNLTIFHQKPSDLLDLDQWLLDQTHQLQIKIIECYEQYQFHQVVHLLHNFCVNELGGFYLDVLKDRMYTLGENHPARLSGQYAMLYCAHSLTRLIAPILSHTAEEIWELLPNIAAEKSHSIFLETWCELPRFDNDFAVWDALLALREPVKKALENLRADKKIGSSLNANLTLYLDQAKFELLKPFGDELRFVFLVSHAEIQLKTSENQENFEVLVNKDTKCERCWHQRPEVGTIAAHPSLCTRCVENIDGEGEVRMWA